MRRKRSNMNGILSDILENGEDGYYELSENEQAVYNIKNLVDAVNGSGLLSYYKSAASSYVNDMLDTLYSLGMDEIAAVIESANAIFPDSYPPEDIAERLEIISEFEDDYAALFYEWTDEILEFISPLECELEALVEALENEDE